MKVKVEITLREVVESKRSAYGEIQHLAYLNGISELLYASHDPFDGGYKILLVGNSGGIYDHTDMD